MRVYRREGSHLFCGHWNGSRIEVGLTDVLRSIPQGDAYHAHPYREYYLALEGSGALLVGGEEITIGQGDLLMIEAGESHRWARIDPGEGLRWVLIKERSEPDGKLIVPESPPD